MTLQELHDLIQRDAPAKSLADAGNDAACAARAMAIAPTVTQPHLVNWRGVASAITLAGMTRLVACFDAVIAIGKAVGATPTEAATGRALEELLPFLRTAEGGGIDVADAQTRGMLDAWAASALLPLTTEDADTLKALANVAPTITAADVATAWQPYRPDGRIQ